MRGVLMVLTAGWSVFGLIVQAALWSTGHWLISLLLSILFHGPAAALVRGLWRACVARARDEREFRGASAGSGELIHTEAGSGDSAQRCDRRHTPCPSRAEQDLPV